MNPRSILLAALTTVSLTILAACAGKQTHPAAPAMISSGMLAGHNGMTLYVFDKDTAGSGKSNCNGACAANWPPFMATAGDATSGDYSVISRDDGGKQWAFKGKPLYYWIKDQKPGDKTGDGFNKVWHVATP